MCVKFKELVQSIDPSLTGIPSGYQRMGNIVFLRSQKILSNKHGEVIMRALPWCQGVFQYRKTDGEFRKPEIFHLAGSFQTEVLHRENGTLYFLDISKIMFSQGNRELRRIMVSYVRQGEYIVDMFAGVGNLSMQIFKYRKVNGLLIEKSTETFVYLKKTVELNKLFNVELINADCREIQRKNIADRILMGYHEIDMTYIHAALSFARQNAIIHLHPLVERGKEKSRIDALISTFEDKGFKIIDVSFHKIKDYGPNKYHFEVIISISRKGT